VVLKKKLVDTPESASADRTDSGLACPGFASAHTRRAPRGSSEACSLARKFIRSTRRLHRVTPPRQQLTLRLQPLGRTASQPLCLWWQRGAMSGPPTSAGLRGCWLTAFTVSRAIHHAPTRSYTRNNTVFCAGSDARPSVCPRRVSTDSVLDSLLPPCVPWLLVVPLRHLSVHQKPHHRDGVANVRSATLICGWPRRPPHCAGGAALAGHRGDIRDWTRASSARIANHGSHAASSTEAAEPP
jgi:hypothetical protein